MYGHCWSKRVPSHRYHYTFFINVFKMAFLFCSKWHLVIWACCCKCWLGVCGIVDYASEFEKKVTKKWYCCFMRSAGLLAFHTQANELFWCWFNIFVSLNILLYESVWNVFSECPITLNLKSVCAAVDPSVLAWSAPFSQWRSRCLLGTPSNWSFFLTFFFF